MTKICKVPLKYIIGESKLYIYIIEMIISKRFINSQVEPQDGGKIEIFHLSSV